MAVLLRAPTRREADKVERAREGKRWKEKGGGDGGKEGGREGGKTTRAELKGAEGDAQIPSLPSALPQPTPPSLSPPFPSSPPAGPTPVASTEDASGVIEFGNR